MSRRVRLGFAWLGENYRVSFFQSPWLDVKCGWVRKYAVREGDLWRPTGTPRLRTLPDDQPELPAVPPELRGTGRGLSDRNASVTWKERPIKPSAALGHLS